MNSVLLLLLYYRKKRFWWHNVKRLQGHLTNKTKQYECDASDQAKYLSDTDGGRAVRIRKASGEQFRLQLTPE